MTDPQAPEKPQGPDPTILPDRRRAVDDRGPAKYFHGRKEEVGFFKDLCEVAREQRGGSIFLIQGAPGAGKTALLHKLAEEAEREKWRVARIRPDALYDPASMAKCLGLVYTGLLQKRWTVDLKIASTGRTRDMPGSTTASDVLRRASSPKRGLILVMDEAQTIALENEKAALTHTLNAIHNGELGRPVILVAGGLGTTERAFGDLGISRFRGDCLVSLGQLSERAERAVIHDWLVREGKTTSDVTPWLDAIAGETDRWPQHVVSFAQPASHVLQLNQGWMSDVGLAYVLQQGQERKEQYYARRVADFDEDDRKALAQAFSHRPVGTTLKAREVRIFLARMDPDRNVHEVFEQLLHKGVIARTERGRYAVPIPSMHNWLVSKYGDRKPPEQKRRLEHLGGEQDQGMELGR